jgi:hypothetical protein
MRTRLVTVAALLVVMAPVAVGLGPAAAQTSTEDTQAPSLEPTASCPQADIDTLQRVIKFVRDKSWADDPGKTALSISPDTDNCRVVLKISELSDDEAAALQRGGENRLTVEETRDHGKASRVPLVLWVVFGGAGLVLIFLRYGRR